MDNIKFHYLYRDGSNYKKWGDVIFSNETKLRTVSIGSDLRRHFLEDGLFIAHQIRIPNVFLTDDYSHTEDDHCYHEFDTAESTSEPVSDAYRRSIENFID